MKICKRGYTDVHVANGNGEVWTCTWRTGNLSIGNLVENDWKEIFSSEAAETTRRELLVGDYSKCLARGECPYLANGNLEDVLVEYEGVPEYPNRVSLSFENFCNYDCSICGAHRHMEDARRRDYTKNYEIISGKIREALPHIRQISANGFAELFCGKRTLELLSEWSPMAPKEEVKVLLETNGSLFDEKHWKQIENLGQYNLTVAITVMSFQEDNYQYLSGTKLPLSNILKNLSFVKDLRKREIVNKFTIATVLQEANFREMPEFVRRCLDEFGADRVRIRPIFLNQRMEPYMEWFMDVRNPYHPYYEQYRKVMQDPIFKDPRVYLWSGMLDSPVGEHPAYKQKAILGKVTRIINNREKVVANLRNMMGVSEESTIIIYGGGVLGKVLADALRNEFTISCIYDKKVSGRVYNGIPIYTIPNEMSDIKGTMLVTVYKSYEEIKKQMRMLGFRGEILDVFSDL